MEVENIKTIHLAADHAGYEHKEAIKEWLKNSVYEVVDHGAHQLHPLDDFPDFINLASLAVNESPTESCAFIFGGSGEGEAMLANRYPEVRATVYYGGNEEIIKLSRQHNDANVLSFGSRFVSVEEVKSSITKWLSINVLEDEKYNRRNGKIKTTVASLYK
ncbi:MAG: RpiB/LacA/LacB family sugar-phosphate isomerase [Candidatus Nomurabacteria bacterium]|nr:MAG: RpiB/LacA/LacB family sugar-phosphate isomerase [Candidatus Nomurabacteria bacterium]